MSNMATVAPSPARRSTVALPIPARSEDSDHNIQSLCRRVASLMYAHRHRLKIHCHWSPEAPPVTIATLPLNLLVAAVELDGVFEAIFVRFQQDRTPPPFHAHAIFGGSNSSKVNLWRAFDSWRHGRSASEGVCQGERLGRNVLLATRLRVCKLILALVSDKLN